MQSFSWLRVAQLVGAMLIGAALLVAVSAALAPAYTLPGTDAPRVILEGARPITTNRGN